MDVGSRADQRKGHEDYFQTVKLTSRTNIIDEDRRQFFIE